MLKTRLLIISLMSCLTTTVLSQPLSGLISRILPYHKDQISVHITKSSSPSNEDFFELSTDQGKLHLSGNNLVSAAYGLNWYLKYYCHCSLSFCGDQLDLPLKLPQIEGRVHKKTALVKNFYMNYCTFGYTTAFWDWQRWEREIDLMALNGVNTPMAMVGAEVVWRNTLRHFQYSDDEIKDFLCGPAYLGWLLMGNLEKHGGPFPEEWFQKRVDLQRKIVARMREYGMTPVFQGFFGMVPHSLHLKYPEANIIDQGEWMGFKRPPILLSTDPLFAQMAEVWYDEYEKLYGRTTCFAGDLFHEGGNVEGVDVSKIASGVEKSMIDYEPNSKWFLQCWGGNPKDELLEGLSPEHVVVIDLSAEFWSRWKERKGFNGFPWIWSHITNYGGNVGLHGRLDAINRGVIAGKTDAFASKSMIGTGSAPEGIEVNPVTFDLANEMRWATDSVNMYDWIKQYAHRRYGTCHKNIEEAWKIFYETAYGSYQQHRRPSESVFCAKPSLKGQSITASAWSQCRIFYDPTTFAKGVALFLESAEDYKAKETYRYDAVDMVRQYLADLGRISYSELVEAYQNKHKELFNEKASCFLQIMLDQDRLLSSHPSFFVEHWVAQARAYSDVKEYQDLYEYNARQLIGTWIDKNNSLRDYAHREWGGMLRDYYYPRWKTYLDDLRRQLDGAKASEDASYDAERRWIESHNVYKLNGEDSVELAVSLFKKYYRTL